MMRGNAGSAEAAVCDNSSEDLYSNMSLFWWVFGLLAIIVVIGLLGADQRGERDQQAVRKPLPEYKPDLAVLPGDVYLRVSHDGGATWQTVGTGRRMVNLILMGWKGYADQHDGHVESVAEDSWKIVANKVDLVTGRNEERVILLQRRVASPDHDVVKKPFFLDEPYDPADDES